MESSKNIVLIGMMGSGKTSIGKILSRKLNLEFVDIDEKIEEKENKTISEIFKNHGEKYFRNLEEKITIQNLKEGNRVISLGGGGFINPRIRKETLKNSISFWLNWKHETLINRIKNSKKRPIAMSLKTFEIKNLIIERSKIYNSSKYKINCDKLDKKQIVNRIVSHYENE